MAKTDMVKAVVLTHRYSYYANGKPVAEDLVDVPFVEGTTSSKGMEIEVPKAEFERGAAMVPPGLAKAGSKEAKAGLNEPVEQTVAERYAPLTDDELAAVVTARGGDPKGLDRNDLLAFLSE